MSDRQLGMGLAFILIGFLALAWAYGLVMPAFENLDEVEHFSAVRYVAETGSLPIHDTEVQDEYHYRQEASQPPLYYVLMAGLVRVLRLPTHDTNSYLVSNPFVACGPADNPYNRHALYHNPAQEAFSIDRLGARPWQGALLTLHVLRAVTPLLQAVTVVGVFAIARLVLPKYPAVALLAAALTAFNPQFLSVASGVNNDNLVSPLATLGLYLALDTRQRGFTVPRSLGLGILTGFASLSKLSGLLLLGFVSLVLLESAWRVHKKSLLPATVASSQGKSADQPYERPRAQYASTIGHGLLIVFVVAAISGWWFWRNWQLYGNLTALEPMLELVGRRAGTALPLNESSLMFRSYWGQLSCAFFSEPYYWFFGLLTLLGSVGFLIGALVIRKRSDNLSGLLWLLLWFGIVYVGWLRWGSITAATGGRLLFPAIASASILLAYGWLRLWSVNWRDRIATAGVVLLLGVAVVTLRWELYPLFAPPQTFSRADVPRVPHPLTATFGSSASDQIGFLGYDAKIDGKAPHLELTLYWKALAAVSQEYALAIQLTSPVPGDDSLRLNYNTWPGRGNYPTTAWIPDRIIADHYRLKLPVSDVRTQAWQLLVAFYETDTGDRLPAYLNGQEVGKDLVLNTLRVQGLTPVCLQEASLDAPVHFAGPSGEVISLVGAVAAQSTTGGLRVSLCWESLAPAPIDYTVFVHLYDAKGELVATGDGPPMNGAFPTRLWQPGDRVTDVHVIPEIDITLSDLESHRIGVGLYDLNSGERLQAAQAGKSLTNNAVNLNIQP